MSNLKKPVKWKEFNFDCLKIGLDKKTPKLYYERRDENDAPVLDELQIQFPHMNVPFGIKENEHKNQWSNFKEYYFDCSLKHSVEEENFNNFMQKLNEKIKSLINECSSFKEPCTDDNYGNIERTGKFNSLIKLNVLRDKEGNFNSYVFRYNSAKKHDKVLIKDENIHEVIKAKTIFIPIVNCSKIYYYKERYGSIWNLIQMLIIEKQVETAPKPESNVYTQYGF